MSGRWGPPLARADLVEDGASTRGLGTSRQRTGGVALPRPIVYDVPPEDVPSPFGGRTAVGKRRVVGLFCPVELEEPGPGQSYGAVTVTVAMPTGHRVVRFPDATDDVAGLYTERFTERFRPPPNGRLARVLVVHALVELAADARSLVGEVSAEAVVRRPIGRFVQSLGAVLERTLPFVEPVPEPLSVGAGRAVRLVVSIDLRAYGTRGVEGGERAQNRLAAVLDRAREATGVAVDDRQEGGDSLMFVFPPGVDELAVLRRFHEALASGLAQANRELHEQAALRVRVGVDRGLTVRAGLGWAGQAPVVAGRLRDAPPTRAATDHAHLAMAVSEPVFRDVFAEEGAVPAAATFRQVDVAIPEKEFGGRAWLHASG